MVKVSVIVPVYNTEKYLEKCLNSLLKQTLKEIEIIVVNDGSTDNSKKVLEAFKEYNNIVYLEKKNGGLSDARNYGIAHANGEYIGFVDSDDSIDSNMYQLMYEKAKESDADLVECDFNWVYPHKAKQDIGKRYINKEDYFTFGRVMACNKIIKLSTIKENNINFPVGLRYEDVEFFYKLVPYIKNMELVEIPLYHYLQRNLSISNNNNESNKDIFVIFENILKFYKDNNIYEDYIHELEYAYIRVLLGSSFLRIVKIKDKKIKEELLNKTLTEIEEKFPNWKQNKILKNRKTPKDLYYKSINKFTFNIYKVIFSIL